MGTRSTIALEFADGTVQSVYCHWDGYLEHNGDILQKHYTDPFKLQQLIELGSLSSLGPNIGEKHQFDNPYRFGTPEATAWSKANREVCTFYGRDRGEFYDSVSMKFDNFHHYVQETQADKGQAYDYILRQIDGKAVWFVNCEETDDYEPLVEVMHRVAIATEQSDYS